MLSVPPKYLCPYGPVLELEQLDKFYIGTLERGRCWLYVLESPGDMKVILASNSPRRRELLSLLGLEFYIIPAEIDETPHPFESPMDYVLRLAAEKAKWVGDRQDGDYLVLAADTTVVDGSRILGKPADEDEAGLMLRQLRGRTHQVYTGIAVVRNNSLVTDLCCTDVPMRNYSDGELDAYIKTGDPLDKAGAYAIQHTGFNPVNDLQGCFANVVGLPLCHLVRALRVQRLFPDSDIPAICRNKFHYLCSIYPGILSEIP